MGKEIQKRILYYFDNTAPLVMVKNPQGYASNLYNGTITVRGESADQFGIDEVLIRMLDDAGEPLSSFDLADGTNAWVFEFDSRLYADPAGDIRLEAQATDRVGNQSTSILHYDDVLFITAAEIAAIATSSILISIDHDLDKPSVTFVSPNNGQNIGGSVLVTGTDGMFEVEADWEILSGTILWTQDLNLNGELYQVEAGHDGRVAIQVRAVDINSLVGNPLEIAVRFDDTIPRVESLSHISGSYVSGSFTLTGSIQDDESVDRVRISYDGGISYYDLFERGVSNDGSITENAVNDLSMSKIIDTGNIPGQGALTSALLQGTAEDAGAISGIGGVDIYFVRGTAIFNFNTTLFEAGNTNDFGDGDGPVQYLPTGTVEIHYVVNDSAGNPNHYVESGFIKNNRLSITALTVGTDLDFSGTVEGDETAVYAAALPVRARLYVDIDASDPAGGIAAYEVRRQSDDSLLVTDPPGGDYDAGDEVDVTGEVEGTTIGLYVLVTDTDGITARQDFNIVIDNDDAVNPSITLDAITTGSVVDGHVEAAGESSYNNAPADVGALLTFPSQTLDSTNGHQIDFSYEWDSALITNSVATDVTIDLEGEDFGAATVNATDGTQVNVVPYISSVSTAGGISLGNVVVAGDYLSVTTDADSSGSGYLTVISDVGPSIPSINSTNSNLLAQNEEDDTFAKNLTLTDDRYIRFFNVFETGIVNGYYADMMMEDSAGDADTDPDVPTFGFVDDSAAFDLTPVREAVTDESPFTTVRTPISRGLGWLQHGMGRDDSGSYSHVSTYNFSTGHQILFHDTYAKDYEFVASGVDGGFRAGTASPNRRGMNDAGQSNLLERASVAAGDASRWAVTTSANNHFDMVITDNDVAVFIYYNQSAGKIELVYTSAVAGNTTPAFVTGADPRTTVNFSAVTQINQSFTGTYLSATIETDGSGATPDPIHIAAHDSANGDLIYIGLDSLTGTTPQIVTVDQHLSVGIPTDIEINDAGVPYITYYNNPENGTRDSVKLAWYKNDPSAAIDPGVDGSGNVTGDWEAMTIPVIDTPNGGSVQFQRVNLDFEDLDNAGAGINLSPVVRYLADDIEYAKILPELP